MFSRSTPDFNSHNEGANAEDGSNFKLGTKAGEGVSFWHSPKARPSQSGKKKKVTFAGDPDIRRRLPKARRAGQSRIEPHGTQRMKKPELSTSPSLAGKRAQ